MGREAYEPPSSCSTGRNRQSHSRPTPPRRSTVRPRRQLLERASGPSVPARHRVRGLERANLVHKSCGIEPDLYADPFAEARTAIESVDPAAVVVVGGLFPAYGTKRASSVGAFLSHAAAARREFATAEVVGGHIYEVSPEKDFAQLRKLSRAIEAAGMRSRIVINEFGWPTEASGGGRIPVHPEPTRSAYTARVVRDLSAAGCRIDSIAPHTLISREQDPAWDHDWFGLVDPLTGDAHSAGFAYARQIGRATAGKVRGPRAAQSGLRAHRCPA